MTWQIRDLPIKEDTPKGFTIIKNYRFEIFQELGKTRFRFVETTPTSNKVLFVTEEISNLEINKVLDLLKTKASTSPIIHKNR